MKISKYLLAIAAILTGMTSCQEEPEPEQKVPEIQIAENDLTINPEGETRKVAYQIDNPVDGVSLEATCEVSWIENIVIKTRVIEFTVGKNETGAIRTAKIKVSYKGAEDVEISVSQGQWDAPITLTVHETDATSVTLTVETSSEDMTWIGQIVGKEWYETYDSEQAIFEADLAYFASEASYYGVSLKEYLAGIMIKGTKQNLTYKGLDPLSDYILYVYGISSEGERTTDLFTAEITTKEPYGGPITFEFDIKETDAIMEATVTPSHDGVDYYWNMITPEVIAEYGDNVQEAVTKWLAAKIQENLEYGDYSSEEEFFEDNTTKNQAVSTFEGIVHTDYIFYAFKWDKECNVIGNVAYIEHTTGGVAPSTNQITVTISDITQSSFHVETTTTNTDPYFLLAEPVSEMKGINLEDDDAVFHYFYDWLGTFYIWSYISNGNMGGNFKELKPNTEYNVVTFGYKSGALTTDIQIQTVKTLPLGDPSDCTFDFKISNIKTTSAEVTIIPSDKGHYYYWDVFPAEMTANMVKTEIRKKYSEKYYGDMWEFSSELTISDDKGSLNYLNPNTSYRIAAIIIDRDAETLEFKSLVHFSETFTTPEAKISKTTVTCDFPEFYDGDEIAQIEPEKFGGMAGYPWIPLKIEIEGEYAEYYYTIFNYEDGLEDPEKYPDSMLYDQLIEVGWSLSTSQYFRGVWDKPLMIAAMAIDQEGNYTKIFRKKFTLTKDKAAPAINFVNNYGKTSSANAVPYAHHEKAQMAPERSSAQLKKTTVK